MSRTKRNREPAMALIFVEKKYILLNNVDQLADLNFISMQLPVEITNKIEIQHIISKLYELNLQTKYKKYLTAYYQADLTILWHVNTTDCY